MAGIKLSQIATAGTLPALTDYAVGVTAGNSDQRFSFSQIQQAIGRIKLTANADYYVATTGNDTTGDGTAGNPWATVQHAADFAATMLDFNSNIVTINIGAGTFAGVYVSQLTGGRILQFRGAGDASTILNDSSHLSFPSAPIASHQFSGAVIACTAMTLKPVSYNSCLQLLTMGEQFGIGDYVHGGGSVTFECANNTYAIFAQSSRILAQGTCTINATTVGGTFSSAITLFQHAFLNDQATWVVNNSPNYTGAFIFATDESHYDGENSLGFTGAATGPRFLGTTNSDFDIPGTPPNLNWFPGNVAGTLDASSTYGGQPFAIQKVGAPTASDLVSGAWSVFKDTNAGTVVIAYNDGGTIRTATLT